MSAALKIEKTNNLKKINSVLTNLQSSISDHQAVEKCESLSPKEVSQLKEAFLLFDKDHDGVITLAEMQMIFDRFGKTFLPSIADFAEVMRCNQHRNISFEQFLKMMTCKSSRNDMDDELLEAFKIFDKNSDGLISAAEMQEGLRNLGEDVSDNDMDLIFESLDKNKDGSISYEGQMKISHPLTLKYSFLAFSNHFDSVMLEVNGS